MEKPPSMLEVLTAPGGYERLLQAFKPSPHKALPVPTAGQVEGLLASENGEALVQALFDRREQAILREAEDPYRFGLRLETWRVADELLLLCILLAIFGGNRSGKTEYQGFKGVQTLVEKPGRHVLWLAESEQSSVEIQQVAVYKYLPPEWKKLKKGAIANVSYSRKNGFSEKKFVLPNGSVGMFGSYKQDVGDYEGMEFDLIVADEDLPLSWLKTLLVRLATRNGKFIWTFTPIHGITPALKEVTEGALTIHSRPAELLDQRRVHVDGCPPGQMPFVQRSLFPKATVLYFHSALNPYGGYEELKERIDLKNIVEVERRFYGYARNTVKALFPMFGAGNVIEREKVPPGTCYHFADPAGSRNMFMIWVVVDAHGRHFIYREWPSVDDLGEWAVPSEDSRKWDGAPGPAQPTLGYGAREYKELILKLEGWRWQDDHWLPDGAEEVESRHIDPRSGAAQAIAEESGNSSLIDRMLDEQLNHQGQIVGPSMDFLPAPGLREEQGILALNDLLAYRKDEPITALVNEPRLFVTRNCQNVIWALKNYTGNDGEKAACKDPIDCLRYMATARLEYLDPKRPRSMGGGSY